MLQNYKVFIASFNNKPEQVEWLGAEIVRDLHSADIVYFSGDKDVSPEYYDSSITDKSYVYRDIAEDKYEFDLLNQAIKLDKIIVGVKKGMHLLNVKAGGKLVYHMNHPQKHSILLYDKTRITVNSYHHQLCKPFNLPKHEYDVIGHAQSLSGFYNGGNGLNTIIKTDPSNKCMEIESLYFHDLNSVGFQYDLEELPVSSSASIFARNIIILQIRKKLWGVLQLKIPMAIIKPWEFEFGPEEEKELKDLLLNREERIKYAQTTD